MFSEQPQQPIAATKKSIFASTWFFILATGCAIWAGSKSSDYYWQHSEMSARQYAMVWDGYQRLSPEGQTKFGSVLLKGFLLKPELSAITDIALQERDSFSIRAGDTGEEAESVTHQIYRFYAGIPTVSIAKDKLLASLAAQGSAKPE
ncbi:hypothetical protein P5706_36075 [Pseudomonas sp. ChxA]|jgi:hypothetical protein|uniref:hypothetical protein n=1 Tax=Pseudomonas TaxID=286 RepID=UPI000998A102|nr:MULTISPECIES: hypothetical protein [Pseudomonas]MBF6043363.1 hypothetical protein [Pseudomonas mucoides]MBJ2202588.1 hypothetical protein [Pseudomonas carnis]MDL2189595.1 hypothetical protein [Pseudomonas sp. ChxA]OOW07018.1 hypothetical protein MF6394_01820 [Pseudomonas sp. MF6394]